MNRRPDGAVLTTADLSKIAIDAGLVTPKELVALHAAKAKGFHSALLDRTREVRFKLVVTVLYFGWHLAKAGSRTWKPTSIQPSTPSTTVYASLAELCAHVDAVNCPKRIHK